jgi:hypothetical protein
LALFALYVRAIRNSPDLLIEAACENANKAGSGPANNWFRGGAFSSASDGCALFLLLLTLIVLVGIWIGAEGPALLIDEALAAAISAGLAPKKGYSYQEAWYRRVVPRSFGAMLAFLACSSTLLWIAERHCPGRIRLSEIVRECVLPGKVTPP